MERSVQRRAEMSESGYIEQERQRVADERRKLDAAHAAKESRQAAESAHKGDLQRAGRSVKLSLAKLSEKHSAASLAVWAFVGAATEHSNLVAAEAEKLADLGLPLVDEFGTTYAQGGGDGVVIVGDTFAKRLTQPEIFELAQRLITVMIRAVDPAGAGRHLGSKHAHLSSVHPELDGWDEPPSNPNPVAPTPTAPGLKDLVGATSVNTERWVHDKDGERVRLMSSEEIAEADLKTTAALNRTDAVANADNRGYRLGKP